MDGGSVKVGGGRGASNSATKCAITPIGSVTCVMTHDRIAAEGLQERAPTLFLVMASDRASSRLKSWVRGGEGRRGHEEQLCHGHGGDDGGAGTM